MRFITGPFLALMALILSCGGGGNLSSDPVSVARIRIGEKVDGECRFDDDLSKYPVSYSGVSEGCAQAVTIGPLSLTELEQMELDAPLFWKESFPYRQTLLGEKVDGECKFDSPAVRAYLEFSETVSRDWDSCVMTVDIGPVTEKQIEKVQRFGTTKSETPVPAASESVPGE